MVYWGLAFDILGAIFIFLGTEVLNRVVTKIIGHVRVNHKGPHYGPPIEYLKELSEKKNISSFFTYIGLLFLVLGFIFQMIAAAKN